MKSVDITLLIQVMNFFIAYYFLHRYVFVPSACILEDQELQDNHLQKLVQESLLQREQARLTMKQRMLQMKQTLQNSIPFVNYKTDSKFNNQFHGKAQERLVLPEQERQKIKKIISEAVSEVKL